MRSFLSRTLNRRAALATTLVALALLPVAPLEAENTRGSVVLSFLEPPQLVAGEPGSIRIRGADFVKYCIARVRLVDTDTLAIASETLDVTVVSDDEIVARFAALPPANAYQVHVANAEGRTRSRSAGNLFLTTVDRPPSVTGVLPPSMDTATGGLLTITGARLAGATEVVLVDGERMVPLEVDSANASTVTSTVPPGVIPGRYKVRVVTPGGINILVRRLTIVDAAASAPKAVALVPDTLTTGAGGALEVRGENLGGVTAVVLLSASGARTTMPASGDATSRTATAPSGLPEGLYEVRLATGAGEVAAPRLQLAVAAAAPADPCFEFRLIGTTGIQVESAGLVARFSRGTLAYVRDSREVAAAIARSPIGLPPGAGIGFDANTIPEANGATSTFLGIDLAGDAGGCVATHRFIHAPSGASFRVIVDTHPASITVKLAFDSAAQTVNFARFDVAGLDPDFDVTLPAFGGCRFDRSQILAPAGIVAAAVHTHHGLMLFEGAAGRVAIDATTFVLRTESYIQMGYRAATRSIDLTLDGKTRKTSLRSGEPLVIELKAATEPFDALYAAARGTFANPAPPGAKRDFSLVLELANQYVASPDAALAAAEEVKRFERDRGIRFPRDKVLVFHLGWSRYETNTRYPDYDEPVNVSFFEPALGAVQMPYISAVAAHENTPYIEKLRDVLMTRWDRALGAPVPVIWDQDLSGAFDHPGDHYFANCSAPAYRDLVEAQIADLQSQVAERTGRRLEGIYLDLAAAVVRDDRNPLTGDHVAGLVELTSRLRALCQDPSTAPIAGEGLSPHTSRAGITHSARGLLFDDAAGISARPASKPGARPHPAVTVLAGAESRGFAHFAGSGIADDPLAAYASRWLSWRQGLLRTTQLGLNNQSRTAWQSDTGRRGTEIDLEEGAYAAAHDESTWLEPHPLWSAPGTAMLLSIDGAPVARTAEWFRDKMVLDAFWHFGGTAPDVTTFTKARNAVAPNIVDVMAAVSQIRYAFTKNPTPPEAILTRAEALRRIRDDLGFDYPTP